MKKVCLVFSLILASSLLFAQLDSTATPIDSAAFEVEEMEPKNLDRDRFIFSLHWAGWLNAPDSLKVGVLSRGIGFHFFYDIPLDKNKQFSFAPGIGYSGSNYTNKAFFNADTAGIVSIDPFGETITAKRNKLVLNYVEIPIEFRYRTKLNSKDQSFKFAVGFKGSYQFANHITYVGDDFVNNTEDELKFKTYRLKSLTTLQYGPTFRFGYSNVNIEAYYGLAGIFQDGKGPEGNPLTIGISFNPF